MGLEEGGEGDELGNGELFGAEGEEGVGEEIGVVAGRSELAKQGTQVVAECLPALVKGRTYDPAEQILVASQFPDIISHESDDSRAHFGWRIEDVGLHGEEVFWSVPGLDEHAQYPISLLSGRSTDSFRNLFLYHARTARNQILIVQHLEENLATYIIRVVPGEYKRLSLEGIFQVHLQKIVLNNILLHLRPRLSEVFYGLEVQLHHFQLSWFLHEELRHHPHSGSNLQNWQCRNSVHGVRNLLCDG